MILATTMVACQSFPGIGETPGSAKVKEGRFDQADLPAAGAIQIPVGTVHLVNSEENFCLIKSNQVAEVEPDTRLYVYGSDAKLSSLIKVTPARKGSFITADLMEGVPSEGDMVMMIHTMKDPDDTSGDEEEMQVLE